MQALFYSAIFGFFYVILAGLISTISQSSMLVKQSQVSQAKEVFSDIEFVVNQKVLGDFMSLSSFDSSFDPSNMLENQPVFLESTGWTKEQLTHDPWHSQVRVVSVERMAALAPGVEAPITAIALVSPGPDKQVGAALEASLTALNAGGGDYRDVLRLEASSASDDIVHTFSTLPAMRRNWKRINASVSTIKNLAEFSYYRQFLGFKDEIGDFYGANITTILASDPASQTNMDTLWLESTIPGVNPISTTTAGYPKMPVSFEAIGATSEFIKVPSGINLSNLLQVPTTAPATTCTTPDECKTLNFIITNDDHDAGWNINFRQRIEGDHLTATGGL